jgi:signal transduction histidine kinase
LFSELEASKEKEKEYSRTLAHKVKARTRELSRSVEELQALGEISQAVSSTLDLTAVLTRIVRHAVQLSKADAGTIYEYEGTDRLFIPRINHGVNTEFIEALHASGLRVGDGSVMGRAAANHRPDQVPDLDEVPDYPLPFVRKAGFRSLLAVPLLCENHLIGGLIVRRKAAGEFPDRVVDLLQTFAAHSALAIHNAQLFQEIEAKNREIQIANRHKSEFLANMSHELRTPLNAILGFTELILDRIYGDIPDKVQDVLKRLMHNGHHLLGLINDVLDLSKIEAGQLNLSVDEYSIEEMIRSALVSMEALAEEKEIVLTHKIQTDLQKAKGDEQRITQVLLNLLGNAIKFTDRGRVHVAVTGSDSKFQVSVSDTGPGISQADQELIFEAFQQADGSNTREKGGTGLGLSIVKRIIEMHGGDIWVESVVGEGSTFHFRLPIRIESQKVLV